MRHDFLDRYSRLDSPVHRLPAAMKLAAGLALLLAIVVVPAKAWISFAAAAGILGVVLAASRIPPLFVLRRLLLLEPFVLAVAALAVFQPGGGRVFLVIVVRSTLCLLTMILVSNTTPFAEILRVLKKVRVPALLITTLALMYRYLFVLLDESQRMRRARLSRTFTRSRSMAWRSLASVVGRLFVRASERGERIYAAMCARGWK